MATRESELGKLLEPAVSAIGHELLGVQVLKQGHGELLRVYIDNEAGVTVDDCVRVSQQVSGVLDVEDPISGTYTLEVSSPGLDRPLFKACHYERFVGHRVRLRLSRPYEGRRKLTGELAGVEDGRVRVLEEDDEWLVPLDMIRLARLVPED